MRTSLLLILAACLSAPQSPQDKSVPGELEQLKGVWSLVSGARDGKPIADEAAKHMKLVFIDDMLTIAGKEPAEDFKIKLKPDKKPCEIDLESKEKSRLGLYRVDGDSLKIALGESGDARPTQLTPEPNSKATFLTLKRSHPRLVKDNVIKSPENPAVNLEFDKAFKYAGSVSFILYGVAHAEQHFFVDLDKDNRVKRLYWVQFEGFLPNNKHTYKYKVTKTANIGGLDFVADASFRNAKSTGRKNSDSARARAFLESKGYRMQSDEVISQRLVHLMGEEKRDELMIIYMEDLAGNGLKAADFNRNGKAAEQWPEMSKQLLERAVKGIKISRE
ncbi:MAG: TIGR03067 domain-containing protein [Planctomycetes bacterium]|nr:TIGR03067 domain-containing protein [Planctomycetota bacterium]